MPEARQSALEVSQSDTSIGHTPERHTPEARQRNTPERYAQEVHTQTPQRHAQKPPEGGYIVMTYE